MSFQRVDKDSRIHMKHRTRYALSRSTRGERESVRTAAVDGSAAGRAVGASSPYNKVTQGAGPDARIQSRRAK
jgi:hypothetical protein